MLNLRLRHLALLAALPLLAPTAADAAPKSKKSKPTSSKSSKSSKSSESSKSSKAKPGPSSKSGSGSKSGKSGSKSGKSAPSKSKGKGKGKKSSKPQQSKALSQLTKEDYVKAQAGKSLELRAPMVLTPARPRHNAWNYLSVVATSAMSYSAGAGGDGRIVLDARYDGWYGNYISLRFRAAANQQYLIDCTVSVHNPEEGKTPSIAMGIVDVNGAATIQDGHALRYLPASPKSRTVNVWVYGVDNGIELSRCEVSLLQ